ncbi:unnamed protein product [Acanthoscelides obtectus]|uniref:Uncharacterized protein n=1 Tax=Acanthoscelides obtectus TaxID=200917 RepID=A0A9P0LA05_ACAOB|nr:unnamed protein product [Acanthoscelides obtectus]CAK1664906.1 Sucrase-isomaltase, intestinal [Acanthoscelides obtectus]
MTFVERHNQPPTTTFSDGKLLLDETDSPKKFNLFICDSCDFKCTTPLKAWCFLAVFAMFVPVFVYYLAIDRTTSALSPYRTKTFYSMKISINEIDADRVNIILHTPEVKVKTASVTEKNYNYTLSNDKLIVEVYRTNSNELLLSTAKGPLIAADRYWEWTVQLTREYMFGLDGTIFDSRDNKTLTKVIYKSKQDHSTLPTFWAYNNGKFHGLTIKHDGPLEITVLPGKLVVLRSISDGTIELQLFVGPTPKQLHDQQIKGKGNVALDYTRTWLLDTFVCRNSEELSLTKIVQNYKTNLGDTFCIDKNLLMSILLTDDPIPFKSLNDLIKDLKQQNKKFLLSVPPYVPVGTTLYDSAKSLDILYKLNGKEYKGEILKQEVVYPDYSTANIEKYIEEFDKYIKANIETEVDGFVLHENWPQNDAFYMEDGEFPYLPKDLKEALSNTIHWNATQRSTHHIVTHNAYGSSQIEAFVKHYPDKPVLSASKANDQLTIPSVLENVETSWENLQKEIDKALFNSITGNHLISLPVCGDSTTFDKVKQETLCLRWYLVSATMPLQRISSGDPQREPQDLRTVFGQNVAKKALKLHKMFKAYVAPFLTQAEPALRPMFYDFHGNEKTLLMREQYMLGDKLLVAHPMTLKREVLQVYLPESIGVWYEFWDGGVYTSRNKPFVSVPVTETDLVAFVAQGSIIPLQGEDSISLTIALNCTSDPCSAHGQLLLDNYVDIQVDGNDIKFNSSGGDCVIINKIKVYYYDRSQNKHVEHNKKVCPRNGDIINIQ